MRIIAAKDIDLIDPFPPSELSHLYAWMRAYKNIVESDLSPKDLPSFEAYFKQLLPQCQTYGVIDRNNSLGFKHDLPIIGMVMFEPNTPWNYYIHVASNRRAWGKSHRTTDGRKQWDAGFMDQAINAAINDVFTNNPVLLRLSAFVLANNAPVRALARRHNWTPEGSMKDMVTQNGEPKTILHYGLTRRDWETKFNTVLKNTNVHQENLVDLSEPKIQEATQT